MEIGVIDAATKHPSDKNTLTRCYISHNYTYSHTTYLFIKVENSLLNPALFIIVYFASRSSLVLGATGNEDMTALKSTVRLHVRTRHFVIFGTF